MVAEPKFCDRLFCVSGTPAPYGVGGMLLIKDPGSLYSFLNLNLRLEVPGD